MKKNKGFDEIFKIKLRLSDRYKSWHELAYIIIVSDLLESLKVPH